MWVRLAAAGIVLIAASPLSVVESVDPVVIAGAPDLVVRATFPRGGAGRLPLIILSHGNALSRNDYRPLVEHWARAGFLVLQPDHVDAATDGVRPAMPQPPDAWRRRIADVRRLLDRLDAVERTIRRRIDRGRIAVAGHSFGGLTAEALVGASIIDPATGATAKLADRRIRAAVLLAPPGGFEGLTPEWRLRSPYLKVDFAGMRGPVLTVAGTEDRGAMSEAGPGWRMEAWRLALPGGKCLVRVPGAGHYLGGINGPTQPPVDIDPARLALVRDATTAFLRSAFDAKNATWTRFRAAHPDTSCK